MFIGRIISDSNIDNTYGLIDVTSDFGLLDEKTPSLIIGKKRAEDIYGKEKIRVLDRKISKNIYWTYSKGEKRVIYEKDVKDFIDNLIKENADKIKYEFFNIFMEKLSRIKRLIEFINSSKIKYIYIYNGLIYLYYNDIVYGLSLNDIEYCGIKKNKVLHLIYRNKNNIIVKNDYFLDKKMREIANKKRFLVPYLYFLTK